MNLNVIRPKMQTEDLLLTIPKKCQMLIEQTLTKPEETLEFKMIKPKETFHFNRPVDVKEYRMIGLTGREVYSFF